MPNVSKHRQGPRARAAVAYLRRSTDKQPLSLEDQRRTIQRWADEHRVPIMRWYTDDAMSGATASDRAAFQLMITEVEQLRDVTDVLCYDVSRFGRTDTDEAGFYRFRLRQAGAEVTYVAETAVNGSETDDLLLPVLQYQKREYLRSLSRDTLRGLIGLAKRGAWCGGPAPLGFARELRNAEGKPVRVLARNEHASTEDGSAVFLVAGDPLEMQAARLAWDLHYLQGVGLATIRDRLTALGVRPQRASAWRTSSIRAIVKNPVFTGRATYGLRTNAKFYRVTQDGAAARPRAALGTFEVDREVEPIAVENAHPSLVSEEAAEQFRRWETADRARLRERKPTTRSNQHIASGTFLLTGLVRCERCGFRFFGMTRRRKGHEYRDYVCSGYKGSGTAVCQRFALVRDDIETHVARVIETRWLAKGLPLDQIHAQIVAEMVAERAQPTPETRSRLREDLARIDARMLAIVQAIDPEHAELANAALTKHKAERAQVKSRLQALEHQEQSDERLDTEAAVVAQQLNRMSEIWAEATGEERKVILPAFLEGVNVNPKESKVSFRWYRVPKMNQPLRRRESHEGLVSLQMVAGAPNVICQRRSRSCRRQAGLRSWNRSRFGSLEGTR